MANVEKYERYGKHYSDDNFWKVVFVCLGRVGREALGKILTLYYVLQNPNVPLKAKGIILGALGYFILPLDLVPDFIPVVGYTDDLAAIAACLHTVSIYVDDDIRAKVDAKLAEIFY